MRSRTSWVRVLCALSVLFTLATISCLGLSNFRCVSWLTGLRVEVAARSIVVAVVHSCLAQTPDSYCTDSYVLIAALRERSQL